MTGDSLFAAAPGFDQPLAVLKHCHDRIRKQLATLDKLLPHLQQYGADQQAQEAAQAVLRYFTQAAPLHHEDEEHDLLPALKLSVEGQDRIAFETHLATILQQHEMMAGMWSQLALQLKTIATGESTQLGAELIAEFKQLYLTHMEIEENHIAPLAARSLSTEQFASMSRNMKERRGISTP